MAEAQNPNIEEQIRRVESVDASSTAVQNVISTIKTEIKTLLTTRQEEKGDTDALITAIKSTDNTSVFGNDIRDDFTLEIQNTNPTALARVIKNIHDITTDLDGELSRLLGNVLTATETGTNTATSTPNAPEHLSDEQILQRLATAPEERLEEVWAVIERALQEIPDSQKSLFQSANSELFYRIQLALKPRPNMKTQENLVVAIEAIEDTIYLNNRKKTEMFDALGDIAQTLPPPIPTEENAGTGNSEEEVELEPGATDTTQEPTQPAVGTTQETHTTSTQSEKTPSKKSLGAWLNQWWLFRLLINPKSADYWLWP